MTQANKHASLTLSLCAAKSHSVLSIFTFYFSFYMLWALDSYLLYICISKTL